MVIIAMILGAAFIYFLQIYIYQKFWYKNLTASVTFTEHVITEHETGELVETITNQKWLPLPMLRVQFETDRHLEFLEENNLSVSDRCYKNDIFSLMMYQKITRRLNFRAIRRGYYTISQIDLDSTDLFMEQKLGLRLTCGASLYVLPGKADTRRLLIPFQKLMGDILTRRYTYEDPFEFQGIRPYQPFDNMRDINWKASARSGALRTNVHGYTVRQEICLLLNLESWSIVDDRLLKEESIRIANGFAELFLAQGIPAGLYSNAKDLITGKSLTLSSGCGEHHLITIRKGLARLDLSKPVEDICQFLNHISQKHNNDLLYVLISSSQRKEIINIFKSLVKSAPGSLWLLPLRKSDRQDVKSAKDCPVIRWEADQ